MSEPKQAPTKSGNAAATVRKREYDGSLRQRQQEVTRESIVGAAQELILEGRLHDFTVQEVASRAGVSPRTVYTHFPSREAILEGMVQRGLERTRAVSPPFPERLEDLPEWAEEALPLLMPYLPLAKAMDTVFKALYHRHVPPQSRERDEVFARLVDQAAPELPDTERKAATASLRLWVSMHTLVELSSRYGLDEGGIMLAVSQGLRAQIAWIGSRARRAREEVTA